MSDYAWIIDEDHLDLDSVLGEGADDSGTIGPRDSKGNTRDELIEKYQNRHQFRMYDDDGELYYTGTLFWDGDPNSPAEHQVYGPLGDFGTPNAGAVTITYAGRPEWDCN